MDNNLKITIALIAATAAISGAMISQVFALFQSYLEKKYKKNTLYREKYEELANHVTESMSWVILIQEARSLKQLNALSVPVHARKALSLSFLYFPLLREDCAVYLNSLVNLQVTLIDSNRRISDLSASAQAVVHNSDEYQAAMSKVQKSRQTLDESVMKYAHRYTKF